MGFVSDWFDAAKNIITSPTEFFENENRRDGFGYPLKFAAFSFLIAGILSAVATLVYGGATEAGTAALATAAGFRLVMSIVGGIISLIIGAGLIHIFVALFGGENGYSKTLGTLAYATAISVLSTAFGLIPILGWLIAVLVGLYGIYVQAKGLEKFQNISFGKSVLAILLPGIILGLIALVIIMTTAASFMALAGASAGV